MLLLLDSTATPTNIPSPRRAPCAVRRVWGSDVSLRSAPCAAELANILVQRLRNFRWTLTGADAESNSAYAALDDGSLGL